MEALWRGSPALAHEPTGLGIHAAGGAGADEQDGGRCVLDEMESGGDGEELWGSLTPSTPTAAAFALSSPPPEDAMTKLRRAHSAYAVSSSPSPRLGASMSSTSSGRSETSFFALSRWYSPSPSLHSARAKASPKGNATAAAGGEDAAKLVRAALRRRRSSNGVPGADGHTHSASSSLSAEDAERLTLSPSSSTDTWEDTETSSLSSSQSSKSSVASCASATSQRKLRAAPSAATLKPRPAPPGPSDRLLRRAASIAMLSKEDAEVAPHSPSSPSFALPSPSLSLSSFTSTHFVSFTSTSPQPPSDSCMPSPTLPSSASSTSPEPSLSLSTRLRRAASNLTLRRGSFTASRPSADTPPMPALPAEIKLRELLLAHDSRAEPSPIPDPSAIPSLPSVDSLASIASTSSLSSQSGMGNAAEDDPFSAFSPFAAGAAPPAEVAWMSQPSPTSAAGAAGPSEDDIFADAESVSSGSSCASSPLPLSPSSHYPPFDPFALASSLGPSSSTSRSLSPSKRREPRARVLTKQRSFVDPRTRKLKTAPGVVVTPCTPDRGGFLSSRRE
ncbi:hypothetical protein JCM10213_004766 [Rhodosporidiobolus nylandii]